MLCEITRNGIEEYSGKKQAHKHKLFDPVALGTSPGLFQGQTQFVPGTTEICSYFAQQKPSLSQGHIHFVPGTNRALRAAEKLHLLRVECAFFAR